MAHLRSRRQHWKQSDAAGVKRRIAHREIFDISNRDGKRRHSWRMQNERRVEEAMPTSYAYDTGGEQARQRLGSLESWLDPETTRHLDSLGVGAGWRCLEVCGGG